MLEIRMYNFFELLISSKLRGKMKEKIDKEKIEYYYFVFVMASVFGWIMELIYSSITLHRLNIPGFLVGPYCPIYGTGAVIVIALCDDKNIFKKVGKIFVLTTVLEYVVSVALEIVVDRKWWDYSNQFLNINGRVCLLYSIYWVIIGLAILKYLNPWFKEKYSKIKSKKTTKIINTIIFIISVDMIISIIYCI